MRRAIIPELNNKLFNTLRFIRQLEESSQLVDSYTGGLQMIFSNGNERLIPFQVEEANEQHPEPHHFSFANESDIENPQIYAESGMISEEDKNIDDFPVIKGIENYSTVVYRKNQTNLTCSICLEDFIEGGEVIRLECFHVFHNNCIRDWAKSSEICPECRREI
jgi:hypothetical protein